MKTITIFFQNALTAAGREEQGGSMCSQFGEGKGYQRGRKKKREKREGKLEKGWGGCDRIVELKEGRTAGDTKRRQNIRVHSDHGRGAQRFERRSPAKEKRGKEN